MSTEATPGLLERFARHRVAPHLVMLLMVLGGLFALSRMNIQFFPNFAVDVVGVSVVWTGASAEDIERGITEPLEERLRSVPNVNTMTSTSAQGISNITIEFRQGTDPVLALNDVREQVDTFRNFPADAETPQISRVPKFDPVGRLLVYGDVDREALRQWVDRFERQLIDRGIDRIEVNGLPEQRIAIEVPSATLVQLGQSLPQLSDTVDALSRDVPAGEFGSADGGRELRAVEQRRRPIEFADLSVVSTPQVRLDLEQIARIIQEPRRDSLLMRHEGQPAAELVLQRAQHGDSLESAEALQQWIDDTRPTLPPHLNLKAYDQSWQLIRDRINLLVTNGFGGLVLVLVLLYLFLPGRVAFWVAAGIPAAFLAALAILWLIGGSINMISLFALIMALGVIVDDAIVVGEDADAHFRAGEPALSASQGAARRMFWPVMASSLTTIAAFMPLLVVGGTIGQILRDIPVVMICVIAASLVEAFLVLPGHLRGAFSGHGARGEAEAKKPGPFARFRAGFDRGFDHFRDHHFRRAVRFAIGNRAVTLATAVATVILAVGLLAGGRIGFTFFPTPESQIVYANATFVAGTDRERMQAFMAELEDGLVRAEEELGEPLIQTAITRLGSTIGAQSSTQGDQLGSMLVELVPPDDRETRNAEFIRSWKENTNVPPGMENFSISSRQGGPPGADLTVRLKGGSTDDLKAAAVSLAETLKSLPGVVDVSDDLPYGRQQITFSVNAQGRALGLTTAEVGRQLRAAYDGALSQIFQSGPDEVEVRLLLPRAERRQIGSLDDISLRTDDGTFVPIRQVVDFGSQRGFEAIRHAEGKRAVEVSAEINRSLTSAETLKAALESDTLPSLTSRFGLDYSFEGRQADQRETMADMKFGLYLGLALMYVVLVWVFSAWTMPFIVMTVIPFGLVGAIAGHWLMDIQLTILSLFGLFGLSGIVVNNAIILVAFYRDQLAAGLAPDDALEQAAVKRLRAVMLTSLTTIGGLTPLLFETSLQAQFLIPMATSIAFGLGYSTLLVLFVVPALLSLRESVHQRVAPGTAAA
ncbi:MULTISPECIES: efflux RND transporter permease subunit [unclassified Guyparkeria]|uniref:efflux RND transporter permease subunit n=1 Tax=unclassified Guyparkeria TaxID=2626246 RepID=UPI0007336E08|nr:MULTISPECIES: efflux RND transporter permease subunit [unclassified Guyparkeria]KTG17854.1 acriflavin resistance protein [Guyparkeria sp. XI15]OAE89565.1 acriflavin resistance protein [Guyparkeria sp. WRN-7]